MNSRIFTGSSYRFDEETIKKNEYRKDENFQINFGFLEKYFLILFYL
jgi:hypothetical protein